MRTVTALSARGTRMPLLLIAMCLGTSIASAQSITVKRSSCRSCRIIVERVATFGALDGPGVLGGIPQPAVKLPSNRYLLVIENREFELLLLEPRSGRPRRIGKAGKGPGEFAHITAITVSGDSVYVFDVGNGRLNVFDSSLRFVRSHPYPHHVLSAKATRDGFIISAMIGREEQGGYPLHQTDRDGRIQRSFGPRVPPARPGSGRRSTQVFAAGASPPTWSANRTAYVLEEFAPDGNKLRTITRDVPWFKPYVQRPVVTPKQGPAPSIRALAVDGNLLWVTSNIADKNFAKALSRQPIMREGQPTYTTTDAAGLYDSVVEVFDTRTGALLASRAIGHWIVGWVSSDHFLTYREDDEGAEIAEVWKVRLKR